MIATIFKVAVHIDSPARVRALTIEVFRFMFLWLV